MQNHGVFLAMQLWCYRTSGR